MNRTRMMRSLMADPEMAIAALVSLAEAIKVAEKDGVIEPKPVEAKKHYPPLAGRNDPCPCGSGTKYKKCCRGKELKTN